MASAAYYNEHDAYAAQWLRNLIDAGLIAPGDVDERSIVDVRPVDLGGYTQCHFFAGIGGWSLAARLAGYPDDRELWTGSCPCQPFSLAGKQKGFADDRHLWPEFRRLISERRPSVVFGEQVASAAEWLGLVRGDLETLGYAVGAAPVEAASAGADHLRDRYWFVADTDDARSQGRLTQPKCSDQRAAWEDGLAHTNEPREGEGREQRGRKFGGSGGDQEACVGTLPDRPRQQVGSTGQSREHGSLAWAIGADGKARRVKPGIRLLAHGVPNRVAKLRAFGNAIDPRPAAEFIGSYLDIRQPSPPLHRPDTAEMR